MQTVSETAIVVNASLTVDSLRRFGRSRSRLCGPTTPPWTPGAIGRIAPVRRLREPHDALPRQGPCL